MPISPKKAPQNFAKAISVGALLATSIGVAAIAKPRRGFAH